MATSRVLAEKALQFAVGNFAKVNDVLLLSSAWILSPSLPKNPTLCRSLPSPIVTSVAYGVLEPLYIWLFLRLGITPWILVLAISPCHLMMSFSVVVLLHKAIVDAIPPRERKSAAPSASTAGEDNKMPTISLPKTYVYVIFGLPLQTAAAANAALVLLAQCCAAPLLLWDEGLSNTWRPLFLESYALFFYLGSRFADYCFSKGTWRAQYLGQASVNGSSSGRMQQFSCLILMILAKAITRIFLGLDMFMVFQCLDPARAVELFRPKQSTWAPVQLMGVSIWVWPVLSAVVGHLWGLWVGTVNRRPRTSGAEGISPEP